MSGAHEGCSQGKSVRDREGSKHSTAATLERVDSQAAVLPQAFKDRVHARQLAGVVQESGAKDESSRFGTLTFNMTHASERGAAARKSQRVTRIAGVEKFVGSRFTPTCNTSFLAVARVRPFYLLLSSVKQAIACALPSAPSTNMIFMSGHRRCWEKRRKL